MKNPCYARKIYASLRFSRAQDEIWLHDQPNRSMGADGSQQFVRLTGERKNYLTTDPNRELFTVRLLFTGTFAYVSNANGASC
jgi:hypothetical protein